MSQRAKTVVKLLEDFRRGAKIPDNTPSSSTAFVTPTPAPYAVGPAVPPPTQQANNANTYESAAMSPDDVRPPKRPWEDMSQEGPENGEFEYTGSPSNGPPASTTEATTNNESAGGGQTTAEQDMEAIRTKRATTAATASGATGQPKSKYRKRSVS
ncbi:hypothetical protein EST38_g7724 [Candolleomyces aberdarensis]|uniref:Uncharacterized protein n=1 Tax=Candolleomyces aberdarensis TaxID=2316362 RepID=A0A4Q2DEF4_9AGAR|nr:hypothetical protein EST38_g7724 [Candolleomyces aberdarensis]